MKKRAILLIAEAVAADLAPLIFSGESMTMTCRTVRTCLSGSRKAGY